MRRGALLVLAGMLVMALPADAAQTPPRVVTASGPLAVLNGVASIDLQAVAPLPLGIPAPAGTVVLAYQSTFEPPGPTVVTVPLWCTHVARGANGDEFFGSGTSSDGNEWFFHLRPPRLPGLWEVSWSTRRASGPCGVAPSGGVPLIGPAAIV